MRIRNSAFLLVLGAIVACSADRSLQPIPTPHPPRVTASVDLSLTGPVSIYQSSARAINDSGVIVGFAQTTPLDRMQAAVWRPPSYVATLLPDLGAQTTSVANGIANDGTIGGEVCESGNFAPCHPVYWRDGVLHQLAGDGVVNDVCPCDGHTLVGRIVVNGHDHAAIWEDEILIDLGVPGDRASAQLVAVSHGNFVGQSYDGVLEGDTAYKTQELNFRWSPAAGWTQLLGEDVEVWDVNASGTAVGSNSILWDHGSSTPIGIEGGSFVHAVNDSGVVGGECVSNPGQDERHFAPCEWTSAGGWAPIGIEEFANVLSINNANLAVGEVFDEGRHIAFLWTP